MLVPCCSYVGSLVFWCCFLAESLLVKYCFLCWSCPQNGISMKWQDTRLYYNRILQRLPALDLVKRKAARFPDQLGAHPCPACHFIPNYIQRPQHKRTGLRLPLIFSTISQRFALRPSRIASIPCTFYCYFCQYL